MEADDFLAGARWKPFDLSAKRKWQPGEPVVWTASDRDDPRDPMMQHTPQLYNLNAVAYESLMLGSFDI